MTRVREESTEQRRVDALERIATARTEAKIPVLVDLLRQVGVEAIVLKGPVTRRRLYGADEARATADIDLLVHPRQHRAAVRALVAVGYVRRARGGHSDTLVASDGELVTFLDLHLAIPFTTVRPGRAFDLLWQRWTTTMEVAGARVRVLDPPAHVVHLAVHAAQNGFVPHHRSMGELRRGLFSLMGDGEAAADEVAVELGARRTWELARSVVARPGERGDLVRELPVRTARLSLRALLALARSPIPLRIRLRGLRAHVRWLLAEERIDAWRQHRGLPPVAAGTATRARARAGCVVVAALERGTGGRR